MWVIGKVMPSVLYFVMFKSYACENFTELCYCFAEGMVIIPYSLHLCHHSPFSC